MPVNQKTVKKSFNYFINKQDMAHRVTINSQTRSSVPPKMPLMNFLFDIWIRLYL